MRGAVVACTMLEASFRQLGDVEASNVRFARFPIFLLCSGPQELTTGHGTRTRTRGSLRRLHHSYEAQSVATPMSKNI